LDVRDLHPTVPNMAAIALGSARASTHFGARSRAQRPVLLMIVFGLFLLIVGVTTLGQAALIAGQISSATIRATVASDAAVVRTFVNTMVKPADLGDAVTPSRAAMVQKALASIASQGEILRIEVRDPDGVVRLSSTAEGPGSTASDSTDFSAALAGTAKARMLAPDGVTEAAGPIGPAGGLLREYFPLLDSNGAVHGVVAVWRDDQPILESVASAGSNFIVLTLTAALIVGLILFFVFRAAQRRISGQTRLLVEAARQDPLTGLLNHGTVVGELSLAIDAAGPEGRSIGVALLDLDNFKGINDTYGHAAGDTVLLQLARALEAAMPPGAVLGRYGPDECLLVVPGGGANELEAVVESVRAAVAEERLEVEGADNVPISLSAGIAIFPDHGDAVTALLSQVAVALGEAKAGGGGATRVAGPDAVTTAEARSFDILQGLVFAVDTKDRYTKRHSEDVARYGAFLARILGFDPDLVEGIIAAGLLHDVGKIGIPDPILRKPGRLSADEAEIVKQHVALGDAIVRNVERIDIIRAGIRHHHERWDGRGYLDALAGTDIPVVGRVLAIADAFSAMTTTRPYRKAMPLAEALKRLGDAAGTQLDERMTATFIHGLETVPDAPLPGTATPARLWIPRPSMT
jgi:diguanylate cyclase (GGDEF)-like protein